MVKATSRGAVTVTVNVDVFSAVHSALHAETETTYRNKEYEFDERLVGAIFAVRDGQERAAHDPRPWTLTLTPEHWQTVVDALWRQLPTVRETGDERRLRGVEDALDTVRRDVGLTPDVNSLSAHASAEEEPSEHSELLSDGTRDDTLLTVPMTTAVWAVIDAILESTCVTAAEDGENDRSFFAVEVRERGNACVRRFDGSWPTDDVISPVTMTRTQWKFALQALRDWAGVSERIGQAENAAAERQAANLISDHLERD